MQYFMKSNINMFCLSGILILCILQFNRIPVVTGEHSKKISRYRRYAAIANAIFRWTLSSEINFLMQADWNHIVAATSYNFSCTINLYEFRRVTLPIYSKKVGKQQESQAANSNTNSTHTQQLLLSVLTKKLVKQHLVHTGTHR